MPARGAGSGEGGKEVAPLAMEWDIPVSVCHRSAASSRGHTPGLGEQTPQDPNTIRIHVTESYANTGIEDQLARLSRWPRLTPPASNTGFRALASQWRDANPQHPCCMLGYEYLAIYSKNSCPKLGEVVRNLRTGFSVLLKGATGSPKWAKTERRILFREDADNGSAGLFMPYLSLGNAVF